jgi:hypothetical protein
MDFANLETAALAHVDDSYYYGAYCGKCKHTARLSLVKLRARLGDDFPLKDVRPRLRCRRCRVTPYRDYVLGAASEKRESRAVVR